jgi:hypothetical protein
MADSEYRAEFRRLCVGLDSKDSRYKRAVLLRVAKVLLI